MMQTPPRKPQIAHDLEDVISVVHQYSIAPWNKLLHKALPMASKVRPGVGGGVGGGGVCSYSAVKS